MGKRQQRTYLNDIIREARKDRQPIVITWNNGLIQYIPQNFHVVYAVLAPEDHVEQLYVSIPRTIPILSIHPHDNNQIRIHNITTNTTTYHTPETVYAALHEFRPVQTKQPKPVKIQTKQAFTHKQRQQRRQQIARELKQGGTAQELATKYGLSTTTIHEIRKEYNIGNHRPSYKDKLQQDIKEKRLDDRTINQIAQQYHLVYNDEIKQENIYTIIADLLNTQLTQTEIAKKHGYTRAWVNHVYHKCLEYNIMARRPTKTTHCRSCGEPIDHEEHELMLGKYNIKPDPKEHYYCTECANEIFRDILSIPQEEQHRTIKFNESLTYRQRCKKSETDS